MKTISKAPPTEQLMPTDRFALLSNCISGIGSQLDVTIVIYVT